VHYGRASLSALSRLPAYFVFGRAPAAPAALAAAVAAHAAGLAGARALVVLLDQPLLWAAPALRAALGAALPGPAGGGGGAAVVLADAAARQLEPGPRATPTPGCTALAGYCWELPAGVQARPWRSSGPVLLCLCPPPTQQREGSLPGRCWRATSSRRGAQGLAGAGAAGG
jgi:hypothetical protein